MLTKQPPEILLEVSDWLSGNDYFNLLQTCRKGRQLLRLAIRLQPAHMHWLTSTKDIAADEEENSFLSLAWTQQGALLGRMRVKLVEEPSEGFPFGRKIGVRQDGDRTAVSRLSLAAMAGIFTVRSAKRALPCASRGASRNVEIRQSHRRRPTGDHENKSISLASSYTSSRSTLLGSSLDDSNSMSSSSHCHQSQPPCMITSESTATTATMYSSDDMEDQDEMVQMQSLDPCVYFEVKILNMAPPCCIRVGLVENDDWDMLAPPGSMPGSLGYCSQDGHISIGSRFDDKFMFGNAFGIGDTIGCGYTLSGNVFFTLNGRWVAEAPRQYEKSFVCDYAKPWHAAVSSSHPARLFYNFGQNDFAYSLIPSSSSHFTSIPPYIVQRNRLSLTNECRVVAGTGDHPQTGLTVATPAPKYPRIFSIDFNDQDDIHRFTGLSITTTLPLTHCQSTDLVARRGGYYYFEVSILFAPDTHNAFLSIGLSERPIPLLHHIGWNKNSIGYHSDDGHVFTGSYQGHTRISQGFGMGSIIGVGYYPESKKVFFTHDGVRLEKGSSVVHGILYPAVAATCNWRISLNVGECLFYYSPANA